MGKRVVVIASGETERRTLPHLTRHLLAVDTRLVDVRVPPGNKQLTVEMAARLIKAAWFSSDGEPPDKFVVLVDVDSNRADDVVRPFREQLAGRLGSKVIAALRFAYACQHLEAWFFADEQGLRNFLGRSLGSVDPSEPDLIENPKLHLKHLLGSRPYTSSLSEQIASVLNVQMIAMRSPSYRDFVSCCKNGL